MSSVYLPESLKKRLISAARRRGFTVERGPSSQLKDYIAYLIELDEATPVAEHEVSTLDRARGLLNVSDPPDDQAIQQLLEQRHLAP